MGRVDVYTCLVMANADSIPTSSANSTLLAAAAHYPSSVGTSHTPFDVRWF